MQQRQVTLLPKRLDGLVAAHALVRAIDGFVARLDIGAAGFIQARPTGIGWLG